MTRRQTAGAIRHRSAEPRLDWQTAPPGMTPDPPDREFRSIQVEHAGSAECILRRSMRGGIRQGCALHLLQARATAGATATAGYPWVGGGAGCGGRRKPIHGGLAAASMPRTLPQPDPPRLRQFPAICSRSTPCVDESLSDNEINRGQIRFPKENGSDPMPSAMPLPGQSNRHRATVEGGAVSDCGVSAAWMPRPSPQGRVHGVPAIRHRPAKPQTTQSRFSFGFGFGFKQVQGAALPPPLPCARKRFH